MAFSPDRRVYGIAKLTINSATGSRTVTATHASGTTWPNAHIAGTSFTVNLVETSTGASPPTGEWILVIVEDNDDVVGEFGTAGAGGDLTANVLALRTLGTGAALPASVVVGDGSGQNFGWTGTHPNRAVQKGGTYRMVLAAASALTEAIRMSAVDTGATIEWHADSDANFARGSLAAVTSASDRDIGGCGQMVTWTARAATGMSGQGNTAFRSRDTMTLTGSIRPAGASSAAIINPKEMKLVLSTDADGATRPDGVYRVTPNTTGDFSQGSILIDTDFGQTLAGTGHYIHIGVNNTFGDSSTPANEKAGIWSSGTISGVTTSQMAAFVFGVGAAESTTPDASGNARNGLLVGTTVPNIVTSPFSGFSNALNFNGVDLDDSSAGVNFGTSNDLALRGMVGRNYANHVLNTSGLQSYWRLSDAWGGTAATSPTTDTGPNGYDGTAAVGNSSGMYEQTALINSNQANGDFGMRFLGESHYFDIGDNYDLTAAQAMTGIGWFQIDDAFDIPPGAISRQFCALFNKKGSPTTTVGITGNLPGWAFYLKFDGLHFHTTGDEVTTTNSDVLAPIVLEVGRKYHLAFVWDTTDVTLYIDGTASATAAIPSANIEPSGYFMALGTGNAGQNNNISRWRLDELQLYNRALSASEITANMNAGRNSDGGIRRTFDIKVKPDILQTAAVLARENATDLDYALETVSDGTFRFRYKTAGSDEVLSGGSYTAGATKTLRVRDDRTYVRLEVDGVEVDSSLVRPITSKKTVNTYIGRNAKTTDPAQFDGTLEEVRVSKTDRTDSTSAAFTSDADTTLLAHLDTTETVNTSGASSLSSPIAEVTISAGLQLKSASDLVSDGVNAYRDSGRTLPNKLFKRTGPTVTTLAIPYLQAYLTDAYGGIYASQSAAAFAFAVLRHSDDAAESSLTSVTTDANGKAEWNYTISASHTAFNRFKNPVGTVDDPDNPPMTAPQDLIDSANPYDEAPFATSMPCYPKHVKVSSNGFSSGKEPSVTVEDVFGVNSEGWSGITESQTDPVGGTFTCDPGQAEDDADGVPTGSGRRNKTILGSLSIKPWTAEVDEGQGAIEDDARSALRDVAGRPISTTADVWYGRWGVWSNLGAGLSRQAMANMSDSGADTDMRLQGSKGYSPNFLTLSAPDDPEQQDIIIGFADTSAQRATLTMTSGTSYGFTSDAGNYGALALDFSWISVDPDLNLVVACIDMHLHDGDTTTIQAKMTRYLANHSHGDVTPDAALHIAVYKLSEAGEPMELLDDTAMDAVAGEAAHFEYEFDPEALTGGDAMGVYRLMVTGANGGSRPPSAGHIDIMVLDTKHQHDKKPLSVGSSS